MQLTLTPEEMGEHLETFLEIDANIEDVRVKIKTAKAGVKELEAVLDSYMDHREKLSREIRNPAPLFDRKPDEPKGKGKPDDDDDKGGGGGGKGPRKPRKPSGGGGGDGAQPEPATAPTDLPEVPADVVTVKVIEAIEAAPTGQLALPGPDAMTEGDAAIEAARSKAEPKKARKRKKLDNPIPADDGGPIEGQLIDPELN